MIEKHYLVIPKETSSHLPK